MKYKLLFPLVLLMFHHLVAQEPVQISGPGILNDKATYLPKPVYPADARDAKVSGIAVVGVVVDENGKVSSAEVIQAHPLLAKAALDAARAAKFPRSAMSGTLIFVFGAPGAQMESMKIVSAGNWCNLGMILEGLDLAPTLRPLEPEALLSMFPADWTTERAMVDRLAELKQIELSTTLAPKPTERVINDRIKLSTVSPEKQNTLETNALVGSLIGAIKGRLATKPKKLWEFNLGLQMSLALNNADSREPSLRESSATLLRDFANTMPSDYASEMKPLMSQMASQIQKGVFSDADHIALSDTMSKIMAVVGFEPQ